MIAGRRRGAKSAVTDYVLDASAVLALLGGEPGSEVVSNAIAESTISAVNLSEVAAKLADVGIPFAEIRAVLAGLPFEVADFGQTLAYEAAALRPATRHLRLSLGDRACLALARRLGVPAVTADRSWADVSAGVEVRLIRP